MRSVLKARPGTRKRVKRLLAGAVFWVMGRGLVACARLDSRVRAEVAAWPDGTEITLAIWPGNPRTSVRKSQGSIVALGSHPDTESTLTVTFKSVDAAFPVLLGIKPVLQGFAEHRATVHGDLRLAMSLVRCLHIVEGYLFPDLMTRRILSRKAVREVNRARAYAGLLRSTARTLPGEETV